MENIKTSHDSVGGSVVQLTQSNIDSVLAANELVLIVFYDERSSFNTRLISVFDNVAKEITEAGFGHGKVVIAKVDCEKEDSIRSRFNLYIYPVMKLFRNGLPSKNNCRCKRNVHGIVEFIKEQLTDPVITFSNLNELHDLCEEKAHIIAYMNSRDQPEYEVLRKVATTLRDEYQFYVKFGGSAKENRCTEQLRVVFRSTGGTSIVLDDICDGSLLNFNDLCTWVQQRPFPLLRELTYENEDKLRNEGLPSVMLIHIPSDTRSVKKFKEVIAKELGSKERLNFLIADGVKFEQLLLRLGKSKSDMPLIAIDYCHHIKLFDYNATVKPGKLKEVICEIHTDQFYQQGIYLCRLTSSDTETELNILGLFE